MAMEIRTQPMVLSINKRPGRLTIQQPKPIVEGSIDLPKVEISTSLPKVIIDQEQAFNESGLKSVSALREDAISLGKQKMQESISRIASQGTELTNIHEGRDQIAEQAINNAFDQFDKSFAMVTMPKTRPKTELIEGQVDTNVIEGSINIKIRAQKAIINYERAKIDTSVKQYNSIKMKYIGENVDLRV